MSVVHLKDGSSFYLPADDAAKLAELRNAKAQLVDLRRFKSGVEWVDPTWITRVTPGGTDPNQKTLPPPARREFTEAELAERRARIDKMKKDFSAREGNQPFSPVET